ncbi:MAG TPA: ferritin family protein [Burkholderiaceae bacterium]|nr:ferritin family protein [Burkholderiaceae bacterium]
MNNVERFLAHAVRLEREAARRYEELAAAMQTHGNGELMQFFARMAHYSRLHLDSAVARSGFRELPPLADDEYEWPDGIAPETMDWAGVDALMDPRTALRLALDSERRGFAYYQCIALISTDSELRTLATTFASEEAQHVVALEKLLAASCS